jgi:Polyketide cyclase / dehydrase and lipid transport
MPANEYHFVSHWTVRATVAEVYDVLARIIEFPRWWPSVYLDAREIEPGERDGRGKTFSLHTRGYLPYTLRWQLRVADLRPPAGYAIEASGDFVGKGVWTLAQRGEHVDITFNWDIRADKPLIRRLSFLFKPLFAANHRWAMAEGERGLRAEVERRRAFK